MRVFVGESDIVVYFWTRGFGQQSKGWAILEGIASLCCRSPKVKGIICDCDSLHHRSRRFVQRAVVRGCGSAGGAGTCGITFYVHRVVHVATPPASAPAAGGGTDTSQLHTATSIFLKAAIQQAHETLVHPRKRRKCAKASYKGQVFF